VLLGMSANAGIYLAFSLLQIRICAVFLTDYGFKGHPLRKDFPLTGFYELNYSDLQQQIMLINVELTQEFRNFTFNIKW